MEEIFMNLVKELPSTAILLLLLYIGNKQFTNVLIIVEHHLTELLNVIDQCLDLLLEGKHKDKEDRSRNR